MRQKNYRGKRLLAGLMLFAMVSSVVADCNVATAFAADNKLNISESEIAVEKEEHQNDVPTEASTISDQNNITQNLENSNITDESNASEEKNISNEAPALKEDYQEDSLTETTPELTPNPEKIPEENPDKSPEITKENKDLEEKNDSEEAKDEDSELDPSEESEENKSFNKESIVDGYKVVIKADEGVFPDGTKVDIKTVDTIGDEDAEDVISEEVEELEPNAEIVKTITFDITFYSKEGKVIEPENGSVSITITPDIQETSELQEIEKELGTALECSVFHVDEELNVEEVECEVKEDFTEISFDAEIFSSYVVTWYAAPDKDGYQMPSSEGPKTIGNFEKVPFVFSRFTVPIAWENDNGETTLRPTELHFTVFGTDIDNSEKVKICDVTVKDYNKTDSTIELVDDAAIPVYVKKKTGMKESGGDASYVLDGFKYEVEFHAENTAYESTVSTVAINKADIEREPNDPVWYAVSKQTIKSSRKELADASFKIEWYDNNNEEVKPGERPRPYYSSAGNIDETALKSKIALYYYTDDDTTPKPVTTDMMPAGDTVETTGPKISKDSYSTWSISYKNLLPVDENGKPIKYVLKLADNFAPGYTSGDDTSENIENGQTRKYKLLGEFKATIQWNDGGMEDYLRPESSLKFKVIDGDNNEINIKPEDIKITKGTGNEWNFEVDNLVMYSDNGVVSYYVTLTDVATLLPDYKVSYTNSPKNTDVSKCHDGGKIFITLQKPLDKFTIHKKWVDGGKISDREALIDSVVTLYLWRYPVKKVIEKAPGVKEVVTGTIEDGAPVNDSHGVQYSFKLNKTDHNKDFDLHLTDFVSSGKLDMYDTQGYQYVYYVTEIMGGNDYVTSYDNINPYTHIETAVADGGTLINLRRESIKIEGIVRWRVPSVTDYTKASATISLQRCDRKTGEWIDVGSPVTVTGFTEADPQKKHVFPVVDKYDEEGHEIKYRVIETNVNYDGSDIGVENYQPVAGSENRYVADNYEMNKFNYTATSHPTYETPSSEAEKYSFTVDNRMSGDVNLDIKKIWKTKEKYGAGDGHYSNITIDIIQKDYQGRILPDSTTPYGIVTVTGVDPLTGEIAKAADGKCYATVTINGEAKPKILITEEDKVIKDDEEAKETNLVWTFDKINLPEFDSEGRAYTYSIKEAVGPGNTHVTYDYEFDGRDIIATANNSYTTGGGDSLYFEIEKEWIDGADLSQRQPVTVAIVNVDPVSGEYSLTDNAGEKHEYVLSAENNWHKEVWLSEHYKDEDGNLQERFNKVPVAAPSDPSEPPTPEKWLWTVIEEDVTFKAEHGRLDGWDMSADDSMDVVHRIVKDYPEKLFSGGAAASADSVKEITGKVDAIVHNDIHRPGYDVSIKAVSTGEGTDPSVFGASKYIVTNKRAGEVNVTFDKTWHDSENKADTRGKAFRVYLYQDGKQVVGTPEEVGEDSNKVCILGVTNPAEKTYTYSAAGNGDSDTFHFNNLPKYDDHGVAYEYSVREFMVRKKSETEDEEIEILTYDTEDTTLSGYVADIEGHEAKVTFGKNEEKLIRNEEYKYNNTLTGKMTTGVPFYVIWHDQSSYDNGGRPDMYFTLYYKTIGSDEAPKKFEGDYKVIWDAFKETTDTGDKFNPYYKRATFTGLPVADEAGNAYEFFAAPSLNNAADHYYERYFNDNNDVKLKDGVNDPEIVIANKETGIHHYDIKKNEEERDEEEDKIIHLADGTKLLPTGGLVEYIIHEEITPKGKKIWKNVDQGISAEDLPDVKIYLGRYSDHDVDNQMYDDTEESSDVTLGKSLGYTSLDSDKLSFDFGTGVTPTPSTAPTAPYAKYDYYGQIYTYQLAEEIFVKGSGTYKLPNYIMTYNPDSLNLVNEYLGAKESSRSITVTKEWKDGEQALSLTGNYPEARFKLYRKEVDPTLCNPLEEGADGIPYNPVTTQYTPVTDLSGFTLCENEGEKVIKYSTDPDSQTATWNNLPIYAPSGRPYFYAVEEITNHGMDSYDIDNKADSTADGGTRDNKKISNTQVLISNNGLDPTKKDADSANQQSVKFTNTLKNTETINKITGKKQWIDNAYFTDVRPTPANCNTIKDGEINKNRQIKLVLRRSAKSQTGAGNAVNTQTFTEGVDYNVTWKISDSDANKWEYEIVPIAKEGVTEFQKYAPNGQPYTYTVKEVLNDVADANYKATTDSASISATQTKTIGTEKILEETTTLKNTLKGQVQLFKKWDDALNEYKLRSGYVDVILQYREVSSTDYTEGYASTDWTTYKHKDPSGNEIEKYRLDPDNKWKLTVTNLPTKNSDGTKIYEYRVLEIDFQDHEGHNLVPITSVESVPKGYSSVPRYNNSTRFPETGHYETKANNYIVNHSIIANLITDSTRMLQVENFLSGKAKLTIEKKWDGIKGDNDYKVLPEQIVYKIQYSTDKDNEASWKDLKKQGTEEINTVTVRKENDWQLVVGDLPLTDIYGNLTYYRAIELGTNLGRFEGYNGEGVPMSVKAGAPGVEYEHYGVERKAISGVDSGSTESSTISTNTLATRNLTVRKKWNDDEHAVHCDVVIELYSANYDRSDGTDSFKPVPGTEATLKAPDYEFTYHNLPLRNIDGKNIVYYVKEVSVDGAAYNADNYDTAFFVSTDSLSYHQVPANSDDSSIAKIDEAVNAKAVCIVNTPKTALNVTKKWNDEANRHRKRKSVIFNLTDDNGGTWTSISSNTNDVSTYTFEKLPMYKAPTLAFVINSTMSNMGKVTYTVTENNSAIAIAGYDYKKPVYTYTVNGEEKTGEAPAQITLDKTASANKVHILNEKNPPKAIITADKEWKDENNRHGSRTSQVDLSLYYRVGTSGNWTLVTEKQLGEDGNYSDGGVYTTSKVTQSLSQNEVDSTSNKWVHTSSFATWRDLPTYKNGSIIYYKVFETTGKPTATLSASYTGDFSGYGVTYSDTNGSTFTNNGETKNQTVTNTLKRTKILVEKKWEDKVAQNIRPYSVTFKLEYTHANKPWITYKETNGQDKLIVVTGMHNQNTWSQLVEDLPYADCEGHPYKYRLKEVSMQIKTPSGSYEDVYDLRSDDSDFTGIDGTTWRGEIGTYDNEITITKSTGTSYNYKATAVNKPDVGSITVTKVWDDINNRDGIRPDTIEVTLYRDGKEYKDVEIGPGLTGTTVDGNKWTYTWTDLPMYKDNAGVHNDANKSEYFVVEDLISDDPVHNYKNPTYGIFEYSITSENASHMTSHVSANTDTTTDLWIKNTHNPIRFKLDGYKKWDDSHADHSNPEFRPSEIDMELQYRVYGTTTWEKVENIPVTSLNTDATKVGTTSANPQTVHNTDHITDNDDIWKVANGWENLPAYVVVTNADGTKESKLVEYSIKEIWNSGDSEKEKHYESEVRPFHYDVVEAKIEGKDYPEDPLIVENIADYNSTLTVIKKWDNQELIERYGALPSELHVRLQNWDNGKWENTVINGVEQTAVLKEHEAEAFENSWSHTFQNLTSTFEYYRVIEEKIVFADGSFVTKPIDSYSSTNLADKGNGTIGNFTISATVDELTHIPLDEGGAGGTTDKAKHWGAVLTNSLPNRKLEVTKSWNDEGDRDKLRPTHVYVTLQRDGENLQTVMLHDANNWTHTWTNLPLYKNGFTEKSDYRVIETDERGNPVTLNGYKVSYAMEKPAPGTKIGINFDEQVTDVDGTPVTDEKGNPKIVRVGKFDLNGLNASETAKITITNTHKPAKTKVFAGKKWDDSNNKFGERATEVYLALFYKYQHEADGEWRLISKQDFTTELGQYTDSGIHTTSDPVQKVTGDSINESWIKKNGEYVATWENLPSRALVDEGGNKVIRIPEYRVVEVKSSSLTPETTTLSVALGGDITHVVNGYKTTQPDPFFVSENGGEITDQIVVNKLNTVNARIIKKWDDQNNKFANRPIRIDFAIQQKGSDGIWKFLTEKINGEDISIYPEMLGADDNTWELLVEGLPEASLGGTPFSYRAVETNLVYADKTVPVFDKNDSSESLATVIHNGKNGYETVEEVKTPETVDGKKVYPTTITNTQDKSAKVTAKKTWNDYDNARNTRPVSIVFEIEKKQVHDSSTFWGQIENILDFFKENGGWTPVYELDSAGEKVVATMTLDGPDYDEHDEVSYDGLPFYDAEGKELVYRAREIQLVYENRTVDVASGANPYLAPTYEDKEPDSTTHTYKTEVTNKIKPDPPKPDEDPDAPPVIPPNGPVNPPIETPEEDPEKPELPPELEEIDEKIDDIEEPEDIVPIVEDLIDLPDSPEREYLVKKLWVVVCEMAKDPTFYDHFDSEMQDILRRFVKTGVLGRRRGLPKTSGLQGSFILLLLGLALILIGTRFNKSCHNRKK